MRLTNKLKNAPLNFKGYMVAGLCFFIDQLSKLAILIALPLSEIRQKITITPFLDFIHIRNSGISYGFFSGGDTWMRWLLTIIAAGLIAICVKWLENSNNKLQALSLGLIIGGGSGNLLDRLIHGAVIDFVSVHGFNYYFYVFNVADSCLTCGIILFFIAEIRGTK